MACSYTATTEAGLHPRSLRGDVYDRENTAAPDAAILWRCSAQATSNAVKRSTVKTRPIQLMGDGRSANNGRSRGACHLLVWLRSWRSNGISPHLVKYAAIIRIESPFVEEQAFLYYNVSALDSSADLRGLFALSVANIHLLKLFTGVEISTRPVRSSGRLGKVRASKRRNDTAEV